MKFTLTVITAFLAASSSAYVASSAPASNIAEPQETASVAAASAQASTSCTTSHSSVHEEASVAPIPNTHFGPIYPEVSAVAVVPAQVSSVNASAVSPAPMEVPSESCTTSSEVDTTSTKTVQITITLTRPLSQSPKAVAGVYPPANVSAPATATVIAVPAPAGSLVGSEHAASNGTSSQASNTTAVGPTGTGSPVLSSLPAPGYVSGSFKLAHATASLTLVIVGLTLLTL